ncbi:gamma-glutamylcyclotransferase family protein [Aureimonas sp. AU20]|uniref:gamma-glutamylcyclotransferase family protein n=1 Tax=Aureimonas sp. AU20 TaxID=1349819 RepID=UPI0007224C1A|nr:gamma-glutamylcyclotransferase family protein [Aureimonas sp. AU20]ALN75574.1 hypothetical protein M673_22790 [Aureimonas sp. AU20]
MTEDADIRLFSYGTLQQENVQIASFGRKLAGAPDAIRGFRREMLEITDPAVLETSGERFHPVVMPSDDASDLVEGTLFRITGEELAAADRYEVDDYRRVEATTVSGLLAWVYVRA